ncbi:DctP family TRAP transporter solute-binding subunit [Pseudomonas matsuisoli]|uniref:C4-dicarboxylate-binding protein n=1 Tax=Pseudomonas matsuisoli TaxID=1515666 RepID=A0A917PLF4_9PSED|nr:DctP family TRAP transporter solute-binding subunit [Pseudomonas matsuisoli]GGJ83790.1 c4-dicarboxylate-binding protein [Pseudomonas matsuisoli]
MFRQMFKPLIAISLALVSFAALAEPVVIKFSHVVAEDTPKGRGALLFQKRVAERLGDKVRVEVYPNSSLYGDDEELEALIRGDVQMLAPSLSKFDRYTRELQVFDLPFLFDDLAAVQRFQSRDSGVRLLGALSNQGITGLAFWNNGMKQLSANKSLKLPADAKGLTFRIQASDMLVEQFEMVGATGVKMPFSESFRALQSGQVQGTENTWSNYYSQKLNTVQPHISETNHGVLSYMLLIDTKFWNGLPFKVRSELQSIADEVTASVNRDAEAINAKNREMIVASGSSTVVTLDAQQIKAWREAMQPLLKRHESDIGASVIRAAQTVNRR